MKIFFIRIILNQGQKFFDMDAADIDPIMKQCITTLSKRPILYKYCMEEIASVRHDALFQKFIYVMSQGPRPIDMLSDNPKRFIADMLAWVHQSVASEKDFFDSILAVHPTMKEQSSHDDKTSKFTLKQKDSELEDCSKLTSVTELLIKVFEGICKPIKVRIEQILISPPNLEFCFDILQLLNFYYQTVTALINANLNISETLQSCYDMAKRIFYERLNMRATQIYRKFLRTPKNVWPPNEIQEAFQLILIFKNSWKNTYEKDDQSHDLSLIVKTIITPLIKALQTSEIFSNPTDVKNDDKSDYTPSFQHIFTINCLNALKEFLSCEKLCHETLNSLEHKIKDQITSLVHVETFQFFQQCKFTNIINLHNSNFVINIDVLENDHDNYTIILNGCLCISEALLQDKIPSFSDIIDIHIKNESCHLIKINIFNVYEALYKKAFIIRDKNDNFNENVAIKHSPDDIRNLLFKNNL